jgi:hypothetical protein
MKLPAASGRGIKEDNINLSPHPIPLPRERELVMTPPQADGVFKNHNKPAIILRLTKLTRSIPQSNGFFPAIENRRTILTIVILASWHMKYL